MAVLPPELPSDRWHFITGVDIFAPPITALRHARGKFHAQRTRYFHNGFKAWLRLW